MHSKVARIVIKISFVEFFVDITRTLNHFHHIHLPLFTAKMATPDGIGVRAGSLSEPKVASASRLHWFTSSWPQFIFAALWMTVHLAALFIWSVRRAYIRARKCALSSLPWMATKNTG